MIIPTDEWLQSLNEKMRQEDVPIRERPWKAIDYYQKEFGAESTLLASPEAKKIFSWFKANTKPGEFAIGVLYKGVFLFDGIFWEVYVPHFYGTVSLPMYNYLKDMTESLKLKIIENLPDHNNYCVLYESLVEYANLKTIVEHPSGRYYGKNDFLINGNLKMNSIVLMLLEKNPNQCAAIGCSEAIELFLKSILNVKFEYTVNTLKKKFGHNIEALFSTVVMHTQDNQLKSLEYAVGKFPGMEKRYDSAQLNNNELWNLYFVTQMIATCSMRILAS